MIANTSSAVTNSTAISALGQLLNRARASAGTLIQWVLVSLFALPLLAHAAVAQLGASASYYGPGPTTGTLSNFTVSAGTNRLLVVTASNTAYLNTTAVSFGITPMTKVVEQNDALVASDSIWVLKLGTGGVVTANIAATFANQVAPLPPGQEVYLSAVVFSGVDQTTPTSSPVSISTPVGTNLSSTLTVTSAVGDLVYDIFDPYHGSAASATPVAGQTVVANNGGAITGGGFVAYTNSSKPGAASVAMGWTSNADSIIQAAINIRQAATLPDLTIAKAANGTFQQGGTASYTVTVTNSGAGPTTATFAMADALPTGLTVSSIAIDATWNCTASTATLVNCVRSTALAAGAFTTITVNVSVAANAPASITNTATISGGGEVVTNNNSGSVTVNVTALTGVTISVPAGISYTFNGQTVTGSQTFNVAPGTYTLSTTTPQALGAGSRAVFSSWSDAGAISHSVTVGSSPLTITGNFTTQFQLTTAASPTNGGTVTPATGTFYDSGTVVNVSATANAGFVFGSWTGPVANAAAAATTVTMDAAKSITANFTALTGVTINVPAGISYTFNGQTVTGSQTFNVAPGTYTLSTTTPQALGAGSRAVFNSWSDAGAISHSVTVAASPLTITGNFTTQYQLTTAASPTNGGTVTPASGTFYDSGTVVNVSATANAGFVFGSWTGPVANAAAAATTVTMDAAKSVTANFTAQTAVTINVPAGISYTFNGQTVTGSQTFQVVPGGYTLATTTPQSLGAGVRAVFSNWSDAGAISHSVTVGGSPLTITGNFTTQYQLTTASAPANGGTVTPASGTFYDSGTVVNVSATANAGFVFGSWTGPVANAAAAATTVTMDAAKSITANFTALTGVTINVPAGISYTFNGQTVTGSQTFQVVPGAYPLATTTPQATGAGSRAVFASWSDAGAISHSVTVGGSPLTITGNFTTQYQLTTASAPANGGTVAPATGNFYDAGTVVNIAATANTGFVFSSWTGSVANSAAAATTVTLDAAKSVTAIFVGLRVFSGPTATGSGVATVVLTTADGGSSCGLTSASWVPVSAVPQPPPASLSFPHGLFDFKAENCAFGSTITLTITYPQPLAAGTGYWKFGPTAANTTPHWYGVPSAISGSTLTFSIADGGLGDDILTPDGAIFDQGGPAAFAEPLPTPTLNDALLALLMLGVLGYGLIRVNRRRV